MTIEILLSGYHSILPHQSLSSTPLRITSCREFLVILTGKQLQAKETAKPLLPLNCKQVQFVACTGGTVWHTVGKRGDMRQ